MQPRAFTQHCHMTPLASSPFHSWQGESIHIIPYPSVWRALSCLPGPVTQGLASCINQIPRHTCTDLGILKRKSLAKRSGCFEVKQNLMEVFFLRWRTCDHPKPKKTGAAQETSLCGEGVRVRLRALKFDLSNHQSHDFPVARDHQLDGPKKKHKGYYSKSMRPSISI